MTEFLYIVEWPDGDPVHRSHGEFDYMVHTIRNDAEEEMDENNQDIPDVEDRCRVVTYKRMPESGS